MNTELAAETLAPGPGAPLVDRVLAPFRRFARTASASGIVLLAATAIALGWANSPWADSYHHLWGLPIGGTLGAASFRTTLHHVINDGLMAVFFFVVGLEIKREILAGELASVKTAALPMIAALGGMVVPAAIYALINADVSTIPGVLIYAISGAHIAMVISAMVFIILMGFRALAGEFTSRQHDGITAAAFYWHSMVAIYALIWISIYVTK